MAVFKTTPVYRLTAEEARSLAKFVTSHTCDRDLSIEFSIGSGIGTNTVVKCLCGKAEADITEYGAW